MQGVPQTCFGPAPDPVFGAIWSSSTTENTGVECACSDEHCWCTIGKLLFGNPKTGNKNVRSGQPELLPTFKVKQPYETVFRCPFHEAEDLSHGAVRFLHGEAAGSHKNKNPKYPRNWSSDISP